MAQRDELMRTFRRENAGDPRRAEPADGREGQPDRPVAGPGREADPPGLVDQEEARRGLDREAGGAARPA